MVLLGLLARHPLPKAHRDGRRWPRWEARLGFGVRHRRSNGVGKLSEVEVDCPVHGFAIKKDTAGGGWVADRQARPCTWIKWGMVGGSWAADTRTRGIRREDTCASVGCPFDRKARSNLRQRWTETDQKRTLFANAVACWAIPSIRLGPKRTHSDLMGAVRWSWPWTVYPINNLF